MKKSLLCGLLVFLAHNGAQASGVESLIRDCSSASDPVMCKVAADEFPQNYDGAMRGEYTQMRNLAYCLSYGCDEAVMEDKGRACAWRMVIMQSGDPEVGSGDQMNLDTICDVPGSRTWKASLKMAKTIYRQVFGKKMPDFDY